MTTGYLSPAFGLSFASLGEIVTLPESGLQVLRRPIARGLSDLMGLYPYSMGELAALSGQGDRAALRDSGAVAVSFVADPFAEGLQAALAGWRLCRPFKTHAVIDLGTDWQAARNATTRRYVRRAAEHQSVETVAPDPGFAPVFWRLYRHTLARREVTGLARMSEAILARQLAVPGGYLTVSRTAEGDVTGVLLSYLHPSHATGHLVALDPAYYAAHTSYLLIQAAAEEAEARGARWYNLGGPAGLSDDGTDGLAQFKRGWTRVTRQSWLCGHVLDGAAYDALAAEVGESEFFPTYRAPGSKYAYRMA